MKKLNAARSPGGRGRLARHPSPIPSGLLAWETPAPTTRLYVVAPSPPLSGTSQIPGEAGRPAGHSQLLERASPESRRLPPGSRPAGPHEPCAPPAGLSGEPAGSESSDSRDASTARDLNVVFSERCSSFQPVCAQPNWQACPLRNPVALDFLNFLSCFSNLVFTYLILVSED